MNRVSRIFRSFPEILEQRIAPAVIVTPDGKSASYTDADGDLVTVKVSTGGLDPTNFATSAAGLGEVLDLLDLSDSKFAGASVAISAKPVSGAGNGLATVGAIDATGIDLAAVTVLGDLGQIDAGDATPTTPALKSLAVTSMGVQPMAASLVSQLAGGAGKISVASDLVGVTIEATGDGAIIGSLAVKGSLIGSSIWISGLLNPASDKAATVLGSLTVSGSVRDSEIVAGAMTNPDVQIGKVTVTGNWINSSLVAGAETGLSNLWGTRSNALVSGGNAVSAKIGGIAIKGAVFGTEVPDGSTGFVAEQIGSFKIGKSVPVLADNVRLTGDGDVRLRLFGGASPTVALPARTSPDSASLSTADLDGVGGFSIHGTGSGSYAGRSVSGGDVNGDGFEDIIIGASGAHSAFVVFGSGQGFPLTLDLANLDGTNGFRMNGPVSSLTGIAVGSAGDINGDGFDDILVGASLSAPNGTTAAGSVYLVYGKESGWGASLSLSALNGSDGFRMDGIGAYDLAGYAVSGAGDINGDGFDDMLIGAQNAAPVSSRTGSAYVVYGKSAAFPATVALSSLNGTNGFRMHGLAVQDGAGSAVSAAGDIDGDGFDDFMIGARGTNGDYDNGSTYLFFGKDTAWPSTVDLSAPDGTTFVRFDGAVFTQSGDSLAAAGDVNGDGFNDIVIGGNSNLYSNEAYVVYGRESFPATQSLASLDGANGFKITGSLGSFVGVAVDGIGDFDGDGFDDLVLGIGGGASQYHSTYVIYGAAQSPATITPTSTDRVAGFYFEGGSGTWSGFSVAGSGDINGDGRPDLIIGAPLSTPSISQGYAGKVFVLYGTETRIEATIDAKETGASFTDENGDLVTVKIGKGTLDPSNFELVKSGLGAKLREIDLTVGAFEGAGVTISAVPTPGLGGTGFATVGLLNAAGINLGPVSVTGDLGAIIAGSGSATVPAVKSLAVTSMGADPQDLSRTSTFDGFVGKITVATDLLEVSLLAAGEGARFDSISAKGSLDSVEVTAEGFAVPAGEKASVVLKSLNVTGSVFNSEIVAGDQLNAQTRIDKIAVGLNWVASSIAAGAVQGFDAEWGAFSNALAPNAGPIASRIASIVVKGGIFGSQASGDAFGFVASQIGSLKIGKGFIAIVDDAQVAPVTGDVIVNLV